MYLLDKQEPNTVLYEDNSDMKILKLFLNFGRYILATPFNLTRKRYCIKCVTFLLLAVSVYITYDSLRLGFIHLRRASVTLLMVNALWIVMQQFFVCTCLMYSNILKLKHWKLLYKKLIQMEVLLRKHKFQVNTKVQMFYTGHMLVISVLSLLHCYKHYIFSCRAHNDISLILGEVVCYFYTNFILMLVYNFAQVFRRRLVFLNKFVINTVNMMLFEKTVISKLYDVINVYKTIFIVVEQFNKIFGFHIFLYVCVAMVQIIISVLIPLESHFNIKMLIPALYQNTTIIISLVALIMSCDSVEKSCQEIIRTCYLLHESVESEEVKEKLLQLAGYAGQWKPVFSAAGFYSVNQSTLTSIFDAIINYLVILIQFSLALRE